MKSFANYWFLFVFLLSGAHAGLDGTKIPNSVMLNSTSSKRPTLKINSPQQNDIIICNGSDDNLTGTMKIGRLAQRMQAIVTSPGNGIESYVCQSDNLNFTSESCNRAIACKKNFSEANGSRVQKNIDEIIAKNYAANMLKYKADSMDQFDLLKRFAKEKYNIESPLCIPRYSLPAQSSSCNLRLLEDVFIDNQEKCKSGEGCFNNPKSEYLTFRDYKKQNPLQTSAYIVDYNDYRISEQYKIIVAQDNALLESLSNLVMSDRFKRLTGEQKADMFLKQLESENGDNYKDPFFALYFGKIKDKNDFKKKATYKTMAQMLEKPFSSAESFKTTYEDLRQKSAKSVLQNKDNCSNTIDLNNICQEMTKFSKGEKVFKNPYEADMLSSKGVNDEIEYERLKDFIGEDITKSKYDVLMHSNRCIAFQLGSLTQEASVAYTSRVWYESVNESTANLDIREKVRSSVIPRKDQFDFVQGKEASSGEISSLQNLDPDVSSNVKKFSSAIAAESQKATNDFSNQYKQSFVPSNYGLDDEDGNGNEADDDFDSTSNNRKGKKRNSSLALIPSGTSPLDPTISDLMKRLEIAEDKVDKMKADEELAENDRVKQKKIEEENALIKELRDQITDLKSVKEKNDSDKANVTSTPIIEQPRGQNNNFAASFGSSSLASAPGRQDVSAKNIDNFESGRSSDNPVSANSSNSRSMNSPTLTSTNNDGNRVLPSATMLTTVDGMSLEKAAQTITSKIIELNGSPFLIEEGGMVKEIIAVVKDGKVQLDENGNPIFEKVIKGKVGDKKFAIEKGKTRAPAAITDVADLKRDQEEKLKHDRAEYLKLKNLTNGVLEKK